MTPDKSEPKEKQDEIAMENEDSSLDVIANVLTSLMENKPVPDDGSPYHKAIYGFEDEEE